MNTIKIQHYLGLTDCYVQLQKTGLLKYFETEMREKFSYLDKERFFSPDALFIWNKGIYLLEFQIRRLSQNQWAQKWRTYNEYFNDRHFEKANWQRFGKGKFLKPQIIVISQQNPEIVQNGFEVEGRELTIVESIHDFIQV